MLDKLLLYVAGVTGGFAGGEKGVQQFVEKGEIKLDETNDLCVFTRQCMKLAEKVFISGGLLSGAA